MKVVTADRSPDGMAASSSQRSRRGQSILDAAAVVDGRWPRDGRRARRVAGAAPGAAAGPARAATESMTTSAA